MELLSGNNDQKVTKVLLKCCVILALNGKLLTVLSNASGLAISNGRTAPSEILNQCHRICHRLKLQLDRNTELNYV